MKKFYCLIVLLLSFTSICFAQKDGKVIQERVHYFVGLVNGNATPSSIQYYLTHNPEEAIYAIRNQLVDARTMIENTPLAFYSMDISYDFENREDYALRMIKAFVQQGWNVNTVDAYNRTILFNAIDKEFLTVVDFLLQNKIDLTVQDKWKDTALIYACSNKDRAKSASKLIATKKGLDLTDEKGDTALVCAIDEKLFDVAAELIKAGANVNIYGKERYSPLYNACDRNNFELVKLLVSKGAKVNAKCGQSKRTPLFEAMYPDNYEMVKFLLEKGADPNAKDKNGDTPMFNLDSCKDKRIPEIMIKYGGDINLKDNDGETPFMDVVRFANMTCIEVFKQHKPNYKVVSKDGYTLLHGLMEGSLPQEVWGVSDSGSWMVGEFDISVFQSVVKLLVDNGVDIDAVNKDGDTALIMACDMHYDMPQYAQVLIENGAKLDIQNKAKETALMMAVGRPKILQLLIDSGANVSLKNEDGKTAYDLAIFYSTYGASENMSKCVQILYNVNPSGSKNITLHQAVLSGNVSLAKDLIKKCKDINEEDSHGRTLLYCAVLSQKPEMVSLVLNKKPDFYKSVYQVSSGEKTPPLVRAIKDRQIQIVELLLKAGADPNEKAVSYYGTSYTPLGAMYYEDANNEKNRDEITKLLIQYGADLNGRSGSSNATDFMLIANYGSNGIFEYVLDGSHGVNLLLNDKNGKFAMDYVDYNISRKNKMEEYLKKQMIKKFAVCTDNLRLRKGAGLYETAFTALKKGTSVKIIDVSPYPDEIDGITGCFVQVEVGADAKDSSGKSIPKGTKGWCFSGYLDIK